MKITNKLKRVTVNVLVTFVKGSKKTATKGLIDKHILHIYCNFFRDWNILDIEIISVTPI